MDSMAKPTTSTTITTTTLISPFEDPAPTLLLPNSTSNSETNPFRVRNSSGSSNATTPVLAAFPTSSPTKMAAPPATSPGFKSRNPFLDMPPEDTALTQKTSGTDVKDVKDISKERKYPSSNGTRPHPRPPRRPEDPTAPHRPSSSHRRRDPSKLSDRDRDRERHRERRDRPSVDPSRRPRPRSNSESSVPSERASRRREDGHIHKPRSRRDKDDSKKDDKKSTTKDGKRRLHPVDKIDLLDVTGLYGSHGFFHHDGPFDACRPHRNKQPHKAPVAAFPADSLTNTLAGGLGEVPGLDRDKYFGLQPQEAFQDYGTAAPTRQRRTSDPELRPILRPLKEDVETSKIRPSVGIRSTSFDPRLKTEPVHGVESAGLGTSTFLEGAPAPKAAIERAGIAEEEENGLVRKKSIVQKIRGRRGTGERSPPPMGGPMLTPNTPNVDAAYNPFFKEGQFVERVESLPNGDSRERADSGGSDKGTGGLLGRVKSLKISGGRRGRKVEDNS